MLQVMYWSYKSNLVTPCMGMDQWPKLGASTSTHDPPGIEQALFLLCQRNRDAANKINTR